MLPRNIPLGSGWETGASFLRFRRALALPIYLIALILDFASVVLGRFAAWTTMTDDRWRT